MPAKRTTVTTATSTASAATTASAIRPAASTAAAAAKAGPAQTTATAAAGLPNTTTTMPNSGPTSGATLGGGLNVNASRPLEMFNGLTRLTPARDLTLGGRGPKASNKKVFAPNLNAVRNKNANVKTSKDFTQSRGNGRRGGRGATSGAQRGGRGGGSGNSSLIQTTGVFSEGVGALQVRKSTGNGTAYARDEVSVSSRKRKDDNKLQQLSVKELLGESDDSDGGNDPASLSDHEMDGDKTELAFKPIALKEGLWHNEKPVVKEEPSSSVSTNQQDSLAIAQHLQKLHVTAQDAILEEPPPQFGRYPRSIGAFLEATSSQMFIMQLPDVLPCVTDDTDDPSDGHKAVSIKDEGVVGGAAAPNSPADQPSSPAASTINQPKLTVLNQLEEGQIGKILRYRSGRVKLLLGDTRFDLDMGLESGFLQEIMSITTNREQRSGDMINLGPVQAKLKATPDWVHLFEQQEANRASATTATNILTTTNITTTTTTSST
ncbi:DNA-directed RNA polymerase III subunit RPC4 [Drosophila tropicalis]|uniref:DNA-directed RNA polymerase III subunit RPC4 n=1 Tax=Drosophila tropicalis TaxID=46794 RepID=UPI0035AB904F